LTVFDALLHCLQPAEAFPQPLLIEALLYLMNF
jgi:hypothetical protein